MLYEFISDISSKRSLKLTGAILFLTLYIRLQVNSTYRKPIG